MYLGDHHIAESAHYDSAIDSINESFSFKPLFGKIKQFGKDVIDKFKGIFSKSSHAKTEKSVDEFFSLLYDSESDIVEEAFGFGKKASYSEIVKSFDYIMNSIDSAFDFEANLMELAISSATKCLNCKTDEEAKKILDETVKKSQSLSAEHSPKVNKTKENGEKINEYMKDGCKAIKKSLSDDELKKLVQYCKNSITRLDKSMSNASKKVDPYIDKERQLFEKFRPLRDKIEYKERANVCAEIMYGLFENYAYKEVQYSLNDVKFTKDDLNYICKCIENE